MTTLSQILAVEKGVKNLTHRDVTALYQQLGTPQLLNGFEKNYHPEDEEGVTLPRESTEVRVKSEEGLADVAKHLTRLFDVTLTKDSANQDATADVVVDGDTLLPDVPVTYLLFLEKNLVDMQTIIRSLPTLDPGESWELDAEQGLYATAPRSSARTEKLQEVLVKYPHTDKHPAQTEMITKDVKVGEWETVRYSGALSVPRRTQLVERVTKLLEAVKYAREHANSAEITDREAGAQIFEYLLAE